MHIVYLIDMNFQNMKTSDAKEKKQLRELSEEELKEVTGGSRSPDECNNQEYRCSHPEVCHIKCVGVWPLT